MRLLRPIIIPVLIVTLLFSLIFVEWLPLGFVIVLLHFVLVFRKRMNLMDHDLKALAAEFGKCDSETMDEIIRQAEDYLDAQLTTALASDQRALIYSSIVGAALAILMMAVASVAASSQQTDGFFLVVVPMTVCFLISLTFSAVAFRPVEFRTVGNNPRQWIEDIRTGQSLHISKTETIALYLRAIEENAETMRNGARALSTALRWGAGGLTAGVIFAVLALGRT